MRARVCTSVTNTPGRESADGRSTRELCRKDVVLTTYGVLSSEMAKHEADAKARASTAPATAAGGGGGGTAGGATGRGGVGTTRRLD